MTTRTEKVATFRALHETGCFIVPNPWDAMSARLLSGLGFKALATTSYGYAFSVAKQDGGGEVGRDEAIAYAAAVAAATPLPVTADLEDGYAPTLDGIAETVAMAADAGLAGLSIEDRNPYGGDPFHDFDTAVRRVEAAVAAARDADIVLTARADGLITGAYGVPEALRRLQAFQAAGADVLYAPGIPDLQTLQRVCTALQAPVNHVLGFAMSGVSQADIAAAGVRRVSLGGSFTRAAAGAVRAIGRAVAGGDFTAIDSAPPWTELRATAPD